MKFLFVPLCAAALVLASPVLADYEKVTTKDNFMALMAGKSLTRPLVNLQVTPDGRISGKGAAWAVSGQWQWKSGFLCRSLEWGGDDLGYNCQSIEADGAKVRITSDKGTGDSAVFRLR